MGVSGNTLDEINRERLEYLINLDKYLDTNEKKSTAMKVTSNDEDSYADTESNSDSDDNSDTDDKYVVVNEALVPMRLAEKNSCSDDTRE